MNDKPMELAERVASILSGHELDDVIPALGMLLAHACQTGNIPKERIVKFIDNVLNIKCELITRH